MSQLKQTLLYTLLSLLIFLTPSNLFFKLYENTAYINGLKIDYLIPKVYLTDLIIIIFIIIFFTRQIINRKIWLPLLFITTLQFISVNKLTSGYFLIRTIMLIVFLKLILTQQKYLKIYQKKYLNYALAITLIFQSLLSYYQFFFQKSFASYFFLGEGKLNSYAGIAKTSINGAEKILPYGTTAHPNVLGGMLSIYLLIYLVNSKQVGYLIKKIVIILSITALLLTQSISAILTFILGYGLIINKNKINLIGKLTNLTSKQKILLPIAVFFFTLASLFIFNRFYPQNTSITRRNSLNLASLTMIRNNTFFGVGVNNFTARVEEYKDNSEVVRFVQPVHNVFLLILSELGIAGTIALWYLLKNFFSNTKVNVNYLYTWLIIILPILLLDHYLITINTGQLLLVWLVICSSSLGRVRSTRRW